MTNTKARIVSVALGLSMIVTACAASGGAPETTSAPVATTATPATVQSTTTVPPATTATVPPPTSTTTTVVLSMEAQDAQAILDQWIAAWNAGDTQALRDLFSPDFTYNSESGVDWVDGAIDRYVGFVDQFPQVTRASEAVEDGSGTFTWVVQFWKDPNGRYPTETLDLDVTFQAGRISHIKEHWHRG